MAAISQEMALVTSTQKDFKDQYESLKKQGSDGEAKIIETELEKTTQMHLQLLNEQSEIIRKQVEADR